MFSFLHSFFFNFRKSSNPNPDDVMKENPNYVRKRKPINFTMDDLEADEMEDDTFEINIDPGTTRTLPRRNCKPKNLAI